MAGLPLHGSTPDSGHVRSRDFDIAFLSSLVTGVRVLVHVRESLFGQKLHNQVRPQEINSVSFNYVILNYSHQHTNSFVPHHRKAHG